MKHLGNITPLYSSDMGEIFFSHIFKTIPYSIEEKYSAREMLKIKRLFRNENRVKACINGRLLLKKYFQKKYYLKNYNEQDIEVLNQNKNGTGKLRIYLQSIPCNEEVSVSYAENYVCIGVSEEYQLGVDVEKIHLFSNELLSLFFTEDEIRNFLLDQEINQTRMWCIKEAILKALGTGYEIGLKNIWIKKEDDLYKIVIKNNTEELREATIMLLFTVNVINFRKNMRKLFICSINLSKI